MNVDQKRYDDMLTAIRQLLSIVPAISPFAAPPQPLVICLGTPNQAHYSNVREKLGDDVVLVYASRPEDGAKADCHRLSEADRTLFVTLDEQFAYLPLLQFIIEQLRSEEVNLITFSQFQPLAVDHVGQIKAVIQRGCANVKLTRFSNLNRMRCGIYNLPAVCDSEQYALPRFTETTPVIICGAGPSLVQQLPLLKSHCKQVVVVAVGHAVGSLNKAGITPDFIVDLDPVCHYNWRNIDIPDSVFVASTCVSPQIAAQFKQVLWLKSDFPQLNAFTDYFQLPLPHVQFAKTVTVSAIDFAVKAGARRIALIGNDLSMSESGRLHADGERSVANEDVVEIEGLDGTTVKTTHEFTALKESLEYYLESLANQYQEKLTVYNCTASGAVIRHTRRMQLKEFVSQAEHAEPGKPVITDNGVTRSFSDIFELCAAGIQSYRLILNKLDGVLTRLLDEIHRPSADIAMLKQFQADVHHRLSQEAEMSKQQPVAGILSMIFTHVDDVINELPVSIPDAGDAVGQLTVIKKRFQMVDRLLDDIEHDFNSAKETAGSKQLSDKYDLNPFVFNAFRNHAIGIVRNQNPELADWLAANKYCSCEHRFKIWLFWKNLPHVSLQTDDGMVPLNPAYINMNSEPRATWNSYLQQTGFDPQRQAMVFFAPGNWAYVVEFAKRFPGIPFLVIDPWPELLNRIICHCQFMHLFPDQAVIVAIDDGLETWKNVGKQFVDTCRREEKELVWFEHPYTWKIAEIEQQRKKIQEFYG